MSWIVGGWGWLCVPYSMRDPWNWAGSLQPASTHPLLDPEDIRQYDRSLISKVTIQGGYRLSRPSHSPQKNHTLLLERSALQALSTSTLGRGEYRKYYIPLYSRPVQAARSGNSWKRRYLCTGAPFDAPACHKYCSLSFLVIQFHTHLRLVVFGSFELYTSSLQYIL